MARFRIPKTVGDLTIIVTLAKTFAVTNGIRGKNKVFIPCRDQKHAEEVRVRILGAASGTEIWI